MIFFHPKYILEIATLASDLRNTQSEEIFWKEAFENLPEYLTIISVSLKKT